MDHQKDEPPPSLRNIRRMCTCNKNYIAQTKQNVEVRWEKHSDINKISEPSAHLKSNPTHVFTWKVLMTAPTNDRARKNFEASFTALSRPLLNEQIDAKKLPLFRNGVT